MSESQTTPSKNKGQKRKREDGEKKFIPGLKRRGAKPKQQCWKCMKPGHSHKECKVGVPDQKLAQIMCFGCREKGHNLNTCPKAKGATGGGGVKCFNCGDEGHASRNCPQDKIGDGATHATCFVCNGTGHLASRCPTNPAGRFPTGGACWHCEGKDHLARDCPNKDKPRTGKKPGKAAPGAAKAQPAGGDSLADDFVDPQDEQQEAPRKKKAKKNEAIRPGTKLWGGDAEAEAEEEGTEAKQAPGKKAGAAKGKTKVVKF